MSDIAWIVENWPFFWPLARELDAEHGRGAFIVDTIIRIPGAGHPFAYLDQKMINEVGDPDAQRMVSQYVFEHELVIILFKEDRVSTYRVNAEAVAAFRAQAEPQPGSEN